MSSATVFDRTVQIGPEFFSKAFSDYNNRFWAFAREIMQNSLDCASSTIAITVIEQPDKDETRVIVANNGEPMTEAVLVGKLLSLGSSGKDFQGAVGGFGKAKEILYFAHKRYTIRTGTVSVQGSGAAYRLDDGQPNARGTMSIVPRSGRHGESLRFQFRRFIAFCGFADRCRFTLDGDKVKPDLAAGDVVRELTETEGGEPWAVVRLATKSEANRLIVRVGGVPMFTQTIKHKVGVVLDLPGTSGTKLTSNRDSLKYPYSGHIEDFITQIAVETGTAFKLDQAEIRKFEGKRLQILAPVSIAATVPTLAVGISPVDASHVGIRTEVIAEAPPSDSPLGFEFHLRNCIRRPVPAEFVPDSGQWSPYAAWVIRAYAGCLLELHGMHEINDTFAIGFVFDEGCIAEYQHPSGLDARVYLINPCRVTKRRSSRAYSRANRHEILAAACHEFVHGGLSESWHDEDYAAKLTLVMARVLACPRAFSKFLNP